MKLSLVIGLSMISIIIIIILILSNMKQTETYKYNNESPKLIHLIYIPWDKNQKLKDDYLDFDKKSYEKLKRNNPEYNIKLWILPDIQEFVRDFYHEYYDIIFNLPRPTMIVDFIRLLVVYHYGGIYWQYGSISNASSINMFQPSPNRKVKLFTEAVLSQEYADKMKDEPIRQGEPEEITRVCNQVFSAVPKHPYIFILFTTAIENSKKYQIKKDYDILYIGANAMMSSIYDKIGKLRDDVELINHKTTKKIIDINSKGSWRTDS